VVIESKSDLIKEVLSNIPPDRVDDVVVLDPADAVAPVGFNPLAGGNNPELAADQLLAVFKGLYGTAFGPRTTDIAAAALHSLARVPNMTLAALPLLITDARFRRRVLGQIGDDIALGPFWAAFENWSDAEKTSAVAPLLNKVRPFLLRENLRVVIGQSHPRFQIRDVFTKRKILLVDCSKGLLGPEVSSLLASLVVSQVWAVALERSAIPAERRHPVSVYLDEFQDYLRLTTDLGDALAQARGLSVSFAVANQFADQLDPATRSALMANAQNKIAFRLSDEDARLMATPGSGLAPEDFADLDAFHFYAQLVARGAVQPWCSGRSLPAGDPISDPDVIRATSRRHYGQARDDIEAELRALVFGSRGGGDGDDLVPKRRSGGSS
jgi:Ni,Fe-hydrogenase maturation factor